jgi:SagB-type dehydrogenase family enzyme
MLWAASCRMPDEGNIFRPHEPKSPADLDVTMNNVISLPAPALASAVSLEEALSSRRSLRTYTDDALTLTDLAQLLWAAQGITDPGGYRTAPSAGALYPLELYVAAGHVEGPQPGVYHYDPQRHALTYIADGDRRSALRDAALGQQWIAEGAAVIAIVADYSRTTVKYGDRGIPYVHMEVGAAAQNIYLQAEARGLGTVFVGAFDDDDVWSILELGLDEEPLALMPVGGRAKTPR